MVALETRAPHAPFRLSPIACHRIKSVGSKSVTLRRARRLGSRTATVAANSRPSSQTSVIRPWRPPGARAHATTAHYGGALRINPKFTFAYNDRGSLLQARGQYDAAMADFHEALARFPPGTPGREMIEGNLADLEASAGARVAPSSFLSIALTGGQTAR